MCASRGGQEVVDDELDVEGAAALLWREVAPRAAGGNGGVGVRGWLHRVVGSDGSVGVRGWLH